MTLATPPKELSYDERKSREETIARVNASYSLDGVRAKERQARNSDFLRKEVLAHGK